MIRRSPALRWLIVARFEEAVMQANIETSNILEDAFFASEWERIAARLEAPRPAVPQRDLLLDLFGAMERDDPDLDIILVQRIIYGYLAQGCDVTLDAFLVACEQLKNRDTLVAVLAKRLDPVDALHPVTGIHPLVHAAQFRLAQTVNILLARLANPNVYDGHGRTPLLAAVFENGIDVTYDDALRATVRFLFQFGANPHKPMLQSHNGVPVGTTVSVVGISDQI